MSDDPRKIVAETLRIVADWGLAYMTDEKARDLLRNTADNVEHTERDDMICCPFCDEDCPLRTYRAAISYTRRDT